MGLAELRAAWDEHGRTDPLWAVLTWPGTRGGRWDPEEFFAFGRTELDRVLTQVRAIVDGAGGTLGTGRALDFGCGVGRLTQALAGRFDEAVGVDVAPSMIEQARQRLPQGTACRFVLFDGGSLAVDGQLGGAFDFVLTAHVLQHIDPALAAGYVGDLVRALRPGGWGMLEVITEPVQGPGLPLPDDGFGASLELLDPPRRCRPGEPVAVRVAVTNTSSATWPAAGREGWYQVQLGNHWRRPDGADAVGDDARAPLPHDLAPGATSEVLLELTAPRQDGDWVLEVDLVQEGVAWFGDKGSHPAELGLQVRSPRPWQRLRPERRPSRSDAVMEMHPMPVELVRSWVEPAGGRVVGSFEWDLVQKAFAPDWHRRGVVIQRLPDGPPAG